MLSHGMNQPRFAGSHVIIFTCYKCSGPLLSHAREGADTILCRISCVSPHLVMKSGAGCRLEGQEVGKG